MIKKDVIPAKAGIHCVLLNCFAQYMREWTPDEV